MADNFEEHFNDSGFGCTSLTRVSSPENLFSIFQSIENETMNIAPFSAFDDALFSPKEMMSENKSLPSQVSERSKARRHELDYEDDAFLSKKKSKVSPTNEEVVVDGQHKVSHIAVERNRRKQMNEHLTVLRSLMPCFYVKRGDQASIIGGVVDYIKELQQVLQSLEAKKQRKVYNEVLSPRPLISSPRPLISSPRPPPHSPRVNLPISPRTPQSGSPYKPRMQNPNCINIITPSSHESSPKSLDSSTDQLAVNSTSSVADVEVKFSGPNVLLNTVSSRIPGQTLKIVSALEGHALEILQVNINSTDDAMLNSFTIKIGIECELSAEELAQEVLQTFSERSAQ